MSAGDLFQASTETCSRRVTLQLETATTFDIVCRPAGSCEAKTGLAGWADIVTSTFWTQGSAETTSWAFCSNCRKIYPY